MILPGSICPFNDGGRLPMTEQQRPLAIDLFTGLHGWAEGLIAAGWRVIGFDLEDMSRLVGEPLPAEHFHLVLQDVLTLHGSQFKGAQLIVGSSPCTEYSYMAMPWTRAKEKAAAIRADETGEARRRLNVLFDAQFRIQREASEAAGRHIPLVVENVKGAQPWVGRAKWSFGSYFLWGDVPALMPIQRYHQRQKVKAGEQWNINRPNFTGTRGWDDGGLKNPGFRFDGSGRSFQSESANRHAEGGKSPVSCSPRMWKDRIVPADHPMAHAIHYPVAEARKGADAGEVWFDQNLCQLPSSSPRRKVASAKIAKIPFVLSHWIGRAWLPVEAAG